MKIAAIVVTYNRRQLLEKTLDALGRQSRSLDAVYVIDNASTDQTASFLAGYQMEATELRAIRTKRNLGGAGGFALGIKRAIEDGYDAVWIMDDDTVARNVALQKLEERLELAANEGQMPSFACSTVVWTDGSLCEMNTPVPTWDFPRPITRGHDYLSVKSCSFVSCLITAEAIRAVGLPYAEYFIWFDDTEYTMRLSRFAPGIYVPGSVVDHLLPQNRGVNFADVNESNIWKFEYGVRNQVSAAMSLKNPAILGSLGLNLLAQLRGSEVDWKLRGRLALAACKGLVFRPHKRFVK